MTGQQVPVIEVGGTHVTAALADLAKAAIVDGTQRHAALNGNGTAADILDQILRTARATRAPAGAHWGAALPGPFDYDRGIAEYHGVGKFDALNGIDFRKLLNEELNAASVTFLNDAHAFLLGEWDFGAARGHDRCAGITLGTGVGSAFLDHGAYITDGPTVPPGGRADLLTINGAPLEDTVSRRAIRTAYRARMGEDPDVDQIAARARAGDRAAADVLRDAFKQLGAALNPWLGRFGATVLVVGGAMTGSWDVIGPPLLSMLAIPVMVATHQADAALLGAAAYTAQRTG